MEDDFNTADAIAAVFELVRFSNSYLSADNAKELLQYTLEQLQTLCGLLGLRTKRGEEILEEEVEALIQERQVARKAKNFARADEIRDELKGRGILLEDTREGVKWKRA